MLNQVTLVGRLVKKPELFVSENGRKGAYITLAVGRSFKNQEGEYDTDFLDCSLWTGIAENTVTYCNKGDVIGVRGRLQSRIVESEDGSKYKKVEIVAEKVTFLTTAKPSDDDSDAVISIEDNIESTKDNAKNNKKNK